jgi:hypothetical protein
MTDSPSKPLKIASWSLRRRKSEGSKIYSFFWWWERLLEIKLVS